MGTETSATAKFMTARELAEFLTDAGLPVDAHRVRVWVHQGKIPATRLPGGHRYMIAREVAEAILRGEYGEPDNA